MKPAPGIVIEQQPEDALFASALVAEAANDGEPGMAAVAQVVMNRLARPARFGDSVRAVLLAKWQFSSFNENDPNRAKMMDLWRRDPLSYGVAEEIVSRARAGSLTDTVGAATHYCTNGLHGTLALWGCDDAERIAAGKRARWHSQQEIAKGATRETATIGRQTFAVTA